MATYIDQNAQEETQRRTRSLLTYLQAMSLPEDHLLLKILRNKLSLVDGASTRSPGSSAISPEAS